MIENQTFYGFFRNSRQITLFWRLFSLSKKAMSWIRSVFKQYHRLCDHKNIILKTFHRKKLIILICRAPSQFRLLIKKKLAELKLDITKWKFLLFTTSKASSSTTRAIELRLYFRTNHFKFLRFTFKIFLFLSLPINFE